MIKIFNTYIGKNATIAVSDVLTSTFISAGRVAERFEKELCDTLSIKNLVTVNSGTSALHLALVAAGVGPGDEVIIPAQTFLATGTSVIQTGAKPVFADINYEDGNINVESVRQKITNKTKAIIPVHWGGYPCDMDELFSLSKEFNLTLIEDAAHAIGASYKGMPIGGISDFTCFSFQAIKHLTTGDGGAVVAKDKVDYNNLRKLRWFGIDRDNSTQGVLGEREFDLSSLGFKYHMNDLSAALGLANLTGFLERINNRIRIAQYYSEELANVDGIKLFNYTQERESAYWLYGIHVDYRLDFVKALKSRGIETSVIHLGIDQYEIFGNRSDELENQRRFDKSQIHIPIHDAISMENAKKVIESIKLGW